MVIGKTIIRNGGTIMFKTIANHETCPRKILSKAPSIDKAIIAFVKRIKILGSFPLIETFCYLSFYYFLLFRPLTKNKNEN